MYSTSDIIANLSAQKDIISEVEEVTNQMLYAPAEELSNLIAVRGELLEKAVKAKDEIRMAARGDQHLLAAIDCKSDVADLTEELVGVFEASLRVKAAVNRICKLETDVLDRLKSEREMALSKIEALNKSSNSIASNYKHAVQTGFPQSFFLERKITI